MNSLHSQNTYQIHRLRFDFCILRVCVYVCLVTPQNFNRNMCFIEVNPLENFTPSSVFSTAQYASSGPHILIYLREKEKQRDKERETERLCVLEQYTAAGKKQRNYASRCMQHAYYFRSDETGSKLHSQS